MIIPIIESKELLENEYCNYRIISISDKYDYEFYGKNFIITLQLYGRIDLVKPYFKIFFIRNDKPDQILMCRISIFEPKYIGLTDETKLTIDEKKKLMSILSDDKNWIYLLSEYLDHIVEDIIAPNNFMQISRDDINIKLQEAGYFTYRDVYHMVLPNYEILD